MAARYDASLLKLQAAQIAINVQHSDRKDRFVSKQINHGGENVHADSLALATPHAQHCKHNTDWFSPPLVKL